MHVPGVTGTRSLMRAPGAGTPDGVLSDPDRPPSHGRDVGAAPAASGRRTGITGNNGSEAGLAAGLVDFNVCSVRATWSGLGAAADA